MKNNKNRQNELGEIIKAQGVNVIQEPLSKNPFKRFGEWLYYIFRDIRRFFHERKMRRLKLGTVCWKDNELKTINISWDIHWMSNVYLAAIIRDYLRFFIKNTPAVGNYVYEHNPEGYSYWEAEEKLDSDEMFDRWKKIVNDTADLFDVLVKSADSNENMAEYQKKVNAAFNALKKIFCDLEWWRRFIREEVI